MLAAVRIRGVPDTRRKAAETLQQLRLDRKHSCMLLPDDDATRGMLQVVKDYVAYGPVTDETIAQLLAQRSGIDDPAGVADGLGNGSVSRQLTAAGAQLPFRLSPPSKGFRDTRRQYGQSGSLGERDDMDTVLQRMI